MRPGAVPAPARLHGRALTAAMRRLLWTIAQHKYGWAHCPNAGSERRLQTAEALERRGLVTIDRSKSHMPTCSATDAGRDLIDRLWPASPYSLGTYDASSRRAVESAQKYHAGHGPNPHPNCPVCSRHTTEEHRRA